MDVVHAQARTAVGRHTHTKHPLLQFRLAHLRCDGHGSGVGAVGVERQKHGIVIAAAGQALLCVQHPRFAVDRTGRQACQIARAIGVIAFVAFNAQRAKAKGRAGVVVHAQRGLVRVGVHFGTAVGNARGRVAAGAQCAQALVLGVVPARLGERLPRCERPLVLHPRTLRRAFGRGRFGARVRPGHVNVGFADQRLRAGLDGQPNAARRFGVRRFFHLQRERRAEITQRGQQFARVVVGRAQQARQLARFQPWKAAKALQFQVFGQVHVNVFRRLNVQRERQRCVVRHARHIGCLVLGAAQRGRQQAAARQSERTQKQQRRPTGRRGGRNSLNHRFILTACAWLLRGPSKSVGTCARPAIAARCRCFGGTATRPVARG